MASEAITTEEQIKLCLKLCHNNVSGPSWPAHPLGLCQVIVCPYLLWSIVCISSCLFTGIWDCA